MQRLKGWKKMMDVSGKSMQRFRICLLQKKDFAKYYQNIRKEDTIWTAFIGGKL